jgi:hypothetical protein
MIALEPPHSDTEDLAPWEQAINWAGVCAAVTSRATIKQVHAEQAPEVSYTRFRRTLHRRATPPPATALRLTHRPGEKEQLDYCYGIAVVDRAIGEVRKTQFFAEFYRLAGLRLASLLATTTCRLASSRTNGCGAISVV